MRKPHAGWRALAFLAALAAAPAFAAAPAPEKAASASTIEDPRQLEALGARLLASGDRNGARAAFESMLDRAEFRQYVDLGGPLREALIAERLGDVDAAAADYRAAMPGDVLREIEVLRILSVHPQRDALVAEAVAFARDLGARAEAGEKPVGYVTSKGEERRLEVMTTAEVVALARRGESARYCYVADLDFGSVEGPLPDRIQLDRCIVGRIRAVNLTFDELIFKGIVLGDTDLGKTWEGAASRSRSFPASRFRDLMLREAVFLGRANFSDVSVSGGRAYFPLAVFEGPADFRGAELDGVAEFRFASFGAGATFKGMRLHAPVYFGGSRYREDTVFTSVFSEREVYFNSAVFEKSVRFDHCDWQLGATFEDASFAGPASFQTTAAAGALNLSRAVFTGPLDVREVHLGSLDAFGVRFVGDVAFQDAIIDGKTRFSLDDATRREHAGDLDSLLPLYRVYQGDEDADAPLTTRSSYGVARQEDLDARFSGDVSFANTVFGGSTGFEGVEFGTDGEEHVASFYNTQFLGETHFEHTVWLAVADFTTVFGAEIAFNHARFERSLILDDASVGGRVALTDATFGERGDLSLYGAGIASLQIAPDQVDTGWWSHRLYYEKCAWGAVDRDDVRIRRFLRDGDLDDAGIRAACDDAAIDEFTALKDSYGGRGMTGASDDAWWWARHHETMHRARWGSWGDALVAVAIDLPLFEACLGWGVRLPNLGIAVVAITLAYAAAYRLMCPETILNYDGEDVPIRDVGFGALVFISAQSMLATNTGWDFGDDDHRFRVLNTSQMVVGVLIVTFFVGAYTRMILA